MMAPGVSENPLSAHYGDLLRPWRDMRWMTLGPAADGPTLTLMPG
jgi:acyl-homoserine lactone acylase PvdQ